MIRIFRTAYIRILLRKCYLVWIVLERVCTKVKIPTIKGGILGYGWEREREREREREINNQSQVYTNFYFVIFIISILYS